MIKPVLILLMVFSSLVTRSQYDSIVQLEIGQPIPDLVLSEMVNSDEPEIRLSDFKGKLLILDLWSINCAGCVKAFPKYEALQKKFSGELVIFPIAFGHTKEKVTGFYDQRKKKGYPINLPTAVFPGITANPFYKMFPVLAEGFPTMIWIDTSGKLRAITGSAELSESLVAKMIKGDSISLRAKSWQKNFDFQKPFLVNQNGGADSLFSYRSLITPYSDSIRTSLFIRQKTDRYTRLFLPNKSIAELFRECLYQGEQTDIFGKRIIIESEKKGEWLADAEAGPRKSNLYCYELILPPTFSLAEAYQFMLDDLGRYFKATAGFEKREMNLLVLKNADTRLETKSGIPFFRQTKDGLIEMRNQPVNKLLSFLNTFGYPIVESGLNYSANIDIIFTRPETYTLPALQRALKGTGLYLEETSRLLDVIVIKDKLPVLNTMR